MILRAYQTQAVEMTRAALAERPSDLLCMPCGAGKTEVAVRLMLDEAERGGRCLFVAHRRELIKQTAKRFWNRTNTRVGVYMAGHHYTNNPIQICSIQTMASRGHMPPASLIVIDEAHLSLAPMYLKLAQVAKREGIKIVGMTATPYRLNPKEHFSVLYDGYSIPIQPSELIAQGWQLQPEIYLSERFIRGETLKTKGGDYDSAAYEAAALKAGGSETLLQSWLAHAKGMKTISFHTSISMARAFADRMTNAGYPFEVIDSKQDPAHNDRAIAAFAKGSIAGLANVNMVAEGFDVPDCACVLLDFASKSRPRFIQAIGRCQRPSPDKSGCVVIDNSNHLERLGPPWQEIVPQMEPAAVRPKKKSKEQPERDEDQDGVRQSEIQDDPHRFLLAQGELLQPYRPEDGFYGYRDVSAFPRPLDAFGREVVRRFGPILVCAGLPMPAYFQNAAPENLELDERKAQGYAAWKSMLSEFSVSKERVSAAWAARKPRVTNYIASQTTTAP
jgi:superfamily II DNA or RNA helicase